MKKEAKKVAAVEEKSAKAEKSTKKAAKPAKVAKAAEKASKKSGKFEPRAGMIKSMFEELSSKPKKPVLFKVLQKMGKADVKNRLYQLRSYGKKYGFRIKIKEDSAVYFDGAKEAA